MPVHVYFICVLPWCGELTQGEALARPARSVLPISNIVWQTYMSLWPRKHTIPHYRRRGLPVANVQHTALNTVHIP